MRFKSRLRNEWALVWLVIAGVLVLTSLPYLYAAQTAPPEKQFMGFMLDVPDHGQYFSWWRSFQTDFLIPNKLTPESNRAVFFNLQWWMLAQFSRGTGLGVAATFQVFRWFAGGLFLWSVYRLLVVLLPGAAERRLAFLLVTFSSGLGFLLVLRKYLTPHGLQFPLSLYTAEGNSFLCILGYPHFAFAAALICLTFEHFWRGYLQDQLRYALSSGFFALLLGWIHAYDLILIYAVIGVSFLAIWIQQRTFPLRLLFGSVIIGALSCSGAIYSFLLTYLDPLWRDVLAQFSNAGVFTPPPLQLVILFGLPLLFAAASLIALVWQRSAGGTETFVMVWFVVQGLLSYLPVDYRIHMLNGWQIPMMVLFAIGFHRLLWPRLRMLGWLGDVSERVPALLLLLLVLPTNLYLFSWRFVDLHRYDSPYYLYQDELRAMEWLEANTAPDEIVFSSIETGQYLPALSGNTAFLAHWAQTLDFYTKVDLVDQFFDQENEGTPREETLSEYCVHYVFHGPSELRLGSYNPAGIAGLIPVYENEHVTLYQVSPMPCMDHEGSGS